MELYSILAEKSFVIFTFLKLFRYIYTTMDIRRLLNTPLYQRLCPEIPESLIPLPPLTPSLKRNNPDTSHNLRIMIKTALLFRISPRRIRDMLSVIDR